MSAVLQQQPALTLWVTTGATAFNSAVAPATPMSFDDLILDTASFLHTGKLTLAEYASLKLAKDSRAAEDKDCRWFSLASFKDGVRNNANVLSVSGFVGDLDQGRLPLAEIQAKLAGVAHLVFTTYSNSAAHPKYRVVVPYASTIDPADHRRLFSYFDSLLDGRLDAAASDPARLSYYPSCCADQGDAAELAFNNVGVYFDPVPVLASMPAAESKVTESTELTTAAVWPVAHADFSQAVAARVKAHAGFAGQINGNAVSEDASANDFAFIKELLRCSGGNGEAVRTFLLDPPDWCHHKLSASKAHRLDWYIPRTILRAFRELSADPSVNTAAIGFGNGPRPSGMSSAPAVQLAPDAMHREAEPLPQARHLATDQRNVDRIIAAYGKRLLSVAGKLYAWSGTHWEPDNGLARRFAGNLSRIVAEEREHAQAQLDELAKAPERPDGEKFAVLEAIVGSLEKWGPKCEMAATQNAALKMLIEAVKIDADKLDADPLLFNLMNGTYNVGTGELQPHNPLDYITKAAPVKFDAAATCPRFDQFLIEVFDSKQVGDFAMRWFGYCATGETREQFVVIHWGQGANGKGTLMWKCIAPILGDYAGAGAPGLLTAKNEDQRHPAEIADLFGKRMVTCSESDEGATLREGFVKQASGEDKMKGRFLHGQFFEFYPTHKMQLMTNKKPVVKGTDHGMWRRLLLLPYLNIFGTPEEIAAGKANKPKDNDLDTTLRAEWPGILNRILEGARAWKSGGLKPPPVVLDASEAYRRSQDRVGEFVRDELTLDINARVESTKLHGHYVTWDAGATGVKPLASTAFLAELEKHVPGFRRNKSHGVRFIYGVTIGQQLPAAPVPDKMP